MDENFVKALDEHHHFPEMIQIKVIGKKRDMFVEDVLAAVREALHVQFEPRYSIRETPHQRHLSVTVDVIAGTAEDLASAYEKLGKVDGVVMLL